MTQTLVTVSIKNLAPNNGNFLTPLWVGFHDGTFDSYDGGASLDGFPGTEALAEDGATEPISDEFSEHFSGSTGAPGAPQDTTIFPDLVPPGPFAPGTAGTEQFVLESDLESNRYFSYASMIIPSNDAFVANGNPLAHRIFDDAGNFIGADFIVFGSEVNDAGTEVNDEIPENTAFFGQMTPNTGVDENGVVTNSTGFNPPGSGGILDDPRFANADFTVPGYEIARITVVLSQVGDAGDSSVVGTEVAQSVFGLAGNDIVFGLEGNDIVHGNEGQDDVNGNEGDDIVYGGQGNDTVRGGQGDDIVSGDLGDDQLFGDLGDDILIGGGGSDSLTGGAGSDTFVLAEGSGPDLILDFEDGVDWIRLDGGLTFADLTVAQGTSTDPTSLESENNTLISVTATSELLAALASVPATAIDAADFV